MFKGNPNILSEGEVYNYSQDEIQEFIRCKEDIIYFAEKYVYISTIDFGRILIKLRDYQKKILKQFINPQDDRLHSILLCPRQSAKTTTTAIYILHYMLYNPNKTVAILANKEDTAFEIMERIQNSYLDLPLFLQQGVREWNKGSIVLGNDTKCIAKATSKGSISGLAISLLYIDEFSKIPSHVLTDFVASTMPVISSGKTAKIIITSCVPKETFVFTSKGIKNVANFVNDLQQIGNGYEVENYKIEGFNGLNDGNVVVNNGIKKTNIIKSKSSEIECTDNHKLWACKSGKFGWFESKDLQVGDYISIKYGMNLWGNNDQLPEIKFTNKHKNILKFEKITKEFAYLIGLYISEGNAGIRHNKQGNVVSKSLDITCGDNISWVFDALKLKWSCYDGIHYRITSYTLVQCLQDLGFDVSKHAKQKEIPERLLEMSKENIIWMLRGMFDGDGSAHKNRNAVSYCSTSKKLIAQLRMILLNFGILTSSLTSIVKPTKKVKVFSTVYVLEMYSSWSLKFQELIGFNLQRKSIRKIEGLIKKPLYASSDLIPFSGKVIKDLKKTNKEFFKFVCENKLIICSDHFSRGLLLTYKDKLAKFEELQEVLLNVREDLKWEQIKSIDNREVETYDFAMPLDSESHEFKNSVLYNGVVGHQTPTGQNLFYDFWVKAIRGKSDFFPIKVNWWEVYSQEFKDATIKNFGETYWLQEYSLRFIGSTNTLIDPDILEKLIFNDPKFFKWNGMFKIWEKPVKNARYVLGIDSGKGLKKNYSVVQVLRIYKPTKVLKTDENKEKIEYIENVEQVAIYRNNEIDPHEYSKVCIEIAKYYNNAYMMIENNNDCGGIVSNTIWYELDYENVCNFESKEIGIRSTKKSKLIANLLLKKFIESKWLKLNDKDTIDELGKYVEVSLNVFKGETRDTIDDCVTSLLWAVYYMRTHYYDEFQGELDDDIKQEAHLEDETYKIDDDRDLRLPLFYIT